MRRRTQRRTTTDATTTATTRNNHSNALYEPTLSRHDDRPAEPPLMPRRPLTFAIVCCCITSVLAFVFFYQYLERPPLSPERGSDKDRFDAQEHSSETHRSQVPSFGVSAAMPSSSDDRPTLSDLLSRPKEDIASFLGGIYEKSPWVAQAFCDKLDPAAIITVRDVKKSMKNIVDGASREDKLELLKSHPDLCEKIDKLRSLTKESQEEQSRAGLQTLTDDERALFSELSTAYREKFGFPFILAVRNASKHTVLSAIEGRLGNSEETEFAAALDQVHKIAWMRLLSAIEIENPGGFLTCHVLDTANGCPAANMRVHLHRLSPPETAGFIAEFRTNDDGRLPGGPALKGTDFQIGKYEWTFFVGDYFARKNVHIAGTPFLDEVPIRFGIDDPEEHYHVPLLVSPWSFSTYRGS